MMQSDAPSSPHLLLCAPRLIRRMACWLYEGILLFGVMVTSGLAYFISAYWLTGLAPAEMNIQPQLKSGLQAISFLVLGIYFTWFWHRGQTLAMKTWRIQIVDQLGHPLTRQAAFKRYIASWLWFIPPIVATAPFDLPAAEVTLLTLGWVMVWALLSRLHTQGQFLHDVIVGTRLISVE